MTQQRGWISMVVVCLFCAANVRAQQSGAVPRLIKFSGGLNPQITQITQAGENQNGKSPSATAVGVTFSLYELQEGGSALWSESQQVQLDEQGRYTVLLGFTQADGLPLDLFTSGKALWLGVQPQLPGAAEQPRVLLVAVPYALKAADADTLGGKPASAFVSVESPSSSGSETPAGSKGNAEKAQAAGGSGPSIGCSVASDGTATAGSLALFVSPCRIQKSFIFESGGSVQVGANLFTSGNVGIGTATPAATLEVNGTAKFDQPVTFAAGQTFPGTGTVTSVGSGAGLTGGPITTSGTLKIATGGVTNAMLANPSLTVNAGTDLTGGGSVALGGNVTLNLDTTKVPTLSSATNTFTGSIAATSFSGGGSNLTNVNAAKLGGLLPAAFQPAGAYATLGANTFGATQTISSGDLSVSNGDLDLPNTTGASVGVITMGGVPFIHACCSASQPNTFIGASAGNLTTTGWHNTASGVGALNACTTCNDNTAIGAYALRLNTSSHGNTASGSAALQANTTGELNTASGALALYENDLGSNNVAAGYCALLNTTRSGIGAPACDVSTPGAADANTAIGTNAGHTNATGNSNTFVGFLADAGSGNLTNAIAIGANAVVGASNALVLGGTGSNAVKVGIGTATPAYTLDVQGTGNFTGPVTFASGQTFPGTGTVTSVGSGAGLTGGPITTSGTLSIATAGVTNAMLANPSLTVAAGTDLTGGGAVSLGGNVTLNLDTTKVPTLAAGSNTFTGSITASSFTGSGAGLTTLNASNLSSGTLPDARLSGTYSSAVTFSNAANSFTGKLSASSAAGSAVAGTTSDGGGSGVSGTNTATTGSAYGVAGTSNSTGGFGVYGSGATGVGGTGSSGYGVVGTTSASTGDGVFGLNTATTGNAYGVVGSSNSTAGTGVYGIGVTGVSGVSGFTTGYGVYGSNTATLGNAYGVYGTSASNLGTGVYGTGNIGVSGTGTGTGVVGTGITGVYGTSASSSGAGVYGTNASSSGTGVYGSNTATLGNAYGVYGTSASNLGTGVYGTGNIGVSGTGTGTGVVGTGITGVYGTSASSGGNGVYGAQGSGSYAGYFQGNVNVTGTLTSGVKDFKIDHPLDAANKYLYHSSVESSEMMNIYKGNVVLDAAGEAVVQLPDWFESLNTDFGYQLTAIGAPGPNLYIAQEVQGNSFRIAGGSPGMKVSWQVTGVRQDAYAKAHPLEVEVDKPESERGYYIHPELYGQPKEKSIEWAHNPQQMRQLESRTKLPESPGGGVR